MHDHGITHRFCCSHTNKNGFVECKHCHVANIGLTLLSTASLPLKFWGETFVSIVHIINLLPTPVLDNVSPHEKLFSSNSDYNFLHFFGCACYPLLRPYNQHRFDFKSSLCLFLGYNNTHKGYVCLTLYGKTIISRHMILNEYLFSFSKHNNPFVLHNDSNTTNSSSSSLPITMVLVPNCSSPITTNNQSSPISIVDNHCQITSPIPVIILHPMITRAKEGISLNPKFSILL